MKIGAVILVTGVGIPDEEMEKFLEMKRPTIFEQMIVSYQRAGVADIALVTRDGMADKIEQTLHRRGVTFLDIESDSFELAVLKGLSYLSDTCERIFVGDIRFPFFSTGYIVNDAEASGRIAWCSIWRYVWRLNLYQSGLRKKYLQKTGTTD